MKCWICNINDANSGEHIIKASDIRATLGTVTQKYPLYINDGQKKITIGSAKSDRLKFSSSICTFCNNDRTQRHDKAWEKFSKYLQERQPPISKGARVKLKKVFPGQAHSSMLCPSIFC
jgi:hypothetical protein